MYTDSCYENSAVQPPDIVAGALDTVGMAASLDPALSAPRPLTGLAVLFMEIQSAAHGLKAPAVHPQGFAALMKTIAAIHAYLALATPPRTARGPLAMST